MQENAENHEILSMLQYIRPGKGISLSPMQLHISFLELTFVIVRLQAIVPNHGARCGQWKRSSTNIQILEMRATISQ